MDPKIEHLERYAEQNHIPIMQKDGINFLLDYLQKHSVQNILEIGTAIGYSAIQMCCVNPDITVTTIERDEQRFQEALQNIASFQLEDRIHVIKGDALEVSLKGTYDLLFIDAAKSQYIKFFERYTPLLKKGGVVVSDNLNFHGLTHSQEPIASRNVRGLVRKLREYIAYLKERSDFQTTFYEIGDGISISIKK